MVCSLSYWRGGAVGERSLGEILFIRADQSLCPVVSAGRKQCVQWVINAVAILCGGPSRNVFGGGLGEELAWPRLCLSQSIFALSFLCVGHVP